ncbi:hypothetical protein MRX96_012872 [Rhipicephalus microplus]
MVIWYGAVIRTGKLAKQNELNSTNAIAQAHKYGLSAAVFVTGWVYETQDRSKLVENQCRFWNFPDELCNEWRIVTLPLKTRFCQGFGWNLYKDSKVESCTSWYNLAKQQLQPRDQGDTTVTYNGGGCLRLEFNPNKFDSKKVEVEPYYRRYTIWDLGGGAKLEEIGAAPWSPALPAG